MRKRAKPARAEPPSQRQLRVAEEIRHVLAGIFAPREFRDPELAGGRSPSPRCGIGPDLKHATAFISRLGRGRRCAAAGIEAWPPVPAGQVAHALRLRYAPELSFQPDHALDYAMKIDS